MSEQYLIRLREMLLLKMEDNDWTLTDTAIQCDISPRRMSDIVNGKAQGITFQTFCTICERLSLSYAHIFDVQGDYLLQNYIEKLVITDGINTYRIVKK